MKESVYIVLEGPDGVGKTAMSKRLVDRIGTFDDLVFPLTEPQRAAGTIGAEIRRRLAEGPTLDHWEAIGLFVADRLQQKKLALDPLLAAGRIVVQDRNWLSSAVYQGKWDDCRWSVDGVPALTPDWPSGLWLAQHHGTIMPKADLLVLLDVDAGIACERLAKRARETGRKLDQFDLDGGYTVRRDRYRKIIQQAPAGEWWDKAVVVDASGNEHEVADEIWRNVSEVLARKGRL